MLNLIKFDQINYKRILIVNSYEVLFYYLDSKNYKFFELFLPKFRIKKKINKTPSFKFILH